MTETPDSDETARKPARTPTAHEKLRGAVAALAAFVLYAMLAAMWLSWQ